MISREGDLIIFECDGEKCHEHFESQTYEFAIALARVKEHHWWVFKPHDTWLHICPDCQDDYRQSMRRRYAALANKLKGNL